MHELSLCQSLCQSLEQEIRTRRLTRVLSVQLAVGSLSCVEPQALEFCFGAMDKAAPLNGCKLYIRRQPGDARCRQCASCYPLEHWLDPCPACGALERDLAGGDDVLIEQMEAY
ncbi:hydrogenase maturation nickel metallochaperone HypA/HybF [Marinobacterium sedimentorum]|uniref:hydrogenase maturation nickel metallochaperone HypA/HybF n=1 Tax=Marinobacterium sedimentorum TaxID=2927804 RepID=UPI0020C66CF7|nr:hydrogenase maturation nickel metallochaperone HypA [Marinobacterium sedimentorum]MCP8690344.1 hydrogenase maturation nickel metallochaperone HypA [Marinobacterium sedimentorum]